MLVSVISHLDTTWLILPSISSVLSWSDLPIIDSGTDTFLLLVLTRHLQYGWFSVLFYQFLLQLRSLFHSCIQLCIFLSCRLEESLSWEEKHRGWYASVTWWFTRSLSSLIIISVHGKEEARGCSNWQVLPTTCPSGSYVGMMGIEGKTTQFQRDLSLSFS